jgi:hypothetical protein
MRMWCRWQCRARHLPSCDRAGSSFSSFFSDADTGGRADDNYSEFVTRGCFIHADRCSSEYRLCCIEAFARTGAIASCQRRRRRIVVPVAAA